MDRRRFALGTLALTSLGGVASGRTAAAASSTATEPDWHDYQDAGMTGHRQYQSPTHGVTVSWSQAWELDAEAHPPVAVAAADDQYRTDLLSLAHDPGGKVAYFQLAFMDRGTTTVADQMDWTLSTDGLKYFLGDPTAGRVLVSDTAGDVGQAWLEVTDSGTIYAVTAIQRDKTLVSCVMTCLQASAEDAWTASAEVMVDEFTNFQVVDWGKIADALAAPSASSPGADTSPAAGANDAGTVDPAYAKAGLTSPTTYTSPQYGYSVEWSAPWTMRPPTDTWGAVTSVAKTGDDTLVLDDLKGNSGQFLATLSIDASPQNTLTREVILSAEEYAKVDYVADTVKITLIDSKKAAHGDTLAVWSQEYEGTTQYRLIAIDTVGDGVQRQTQLDLHGTSPTDDFATLSAAISMDKGPILLGYTPKEFSAAVASA
ncbi:MAG: hypothetical protein WBA46_07680 [Thermomicrobiales bacterium]